MELTLSTFVSHMFYGPLFSKRGPMEVTKGLLFTVQVEQAVENVSFSVTNFAIRFYWSFGVLAFCQLKAVLRS